MSIKKTVFCFIFSEIKNQFFFVSLTPCLLFRGLNLSVVNYQNHGKTQEKVNLTLCYGHYMTDITLWTSHLTLYYGHYDCMTFIMVILLGEINATCIPILFKFITSKFAVLLTKH